MDKKVAKYRKDPVVQQVTVKRIPGTNTPCVEPNFNPYKNARYMPLSNIAYMWGYGTNTVIDAK